MAIYSCNLKSIGRTTHEAGTAGAHIRYISRPDAEPEVFSHHMPDEAVEARTWMDNRERAMRKNARVIDKIRIALPRELTDVQRADLLQGFMADLTGGHIPWYAAIHQTGKDAHNPHVHIAVHDRDIETGKRVLRLSDSARDRRKAGLPGPKAVDWIRERWEAACNAYLERVGVDARVDRRTLEAQGIDREPTIHEGPRAQHINDNVKRPKSQKRINGCGRVIDYPAIDKGRTRREFNAHIIELNLERAARSKNPETAIWAQFEKDQMAKDKDLESRLAREQRERTAKQRNTSLLYAARIRRLRAERNLKTRAAVKKVRDKFAKRRDKLRDEQNRERQALTNKQSRLHIRIFTILDFTGITGRRQEAARKALAQIHKAARRAFSERYQEQLRFAGQATKARYETQIEEQQAKRLQHLAQFKNQHGQAENFADIERQKREAAREHMRQITEARIATWAKHQREGGHRKAVGDFTEAIMKVIEQEADRPKDIGKDLERDGPG